jgi:hypothetical protein
MELDNYNEAGKGGTRAQISKDEEFTPAALPLTRKLDVCRPRIRKEL